MAAWQEPREPLVGGATIAAWRRRQQAWPAVPTATGGGQPSNGLPARSGPDSAGSQDAIDGEFAASQQAGLLAMISLANADSSISRPAATNSDTPGPRPLTSPRSQSASLLPGPVATLAPLTEQPRTPRRPARSAPGHSRTPRVQANQDPTATQASSRLADLWPPLLIATLTLQTVLSLRLVWSNTAGVDEATYLWAGHLEIAHWLQGTPVPPFQTWLAGAPVFYPPVGAIANGIGGLVGARILSLVFMLAATTLLWDVTSRLFGGRAAFFATTMFALLGPTQFLGASATYDAMALLLIAVSAWCVVAARNHSDSTVLLVAGAVVLALANATEYGTVLFDPVIAALAALVITRKRGVKPALGRAGYLAACVTAFAAALLALGGPLYMAGAMYTTLARTTGLSSPSSVLEEAWKWVGLVWVIAWIGVILSLRRGSKGQTILLVLLAASGLLVPLDEARIHTLTSLHKQVDFGAWLAAPAVGYALARLSRISKRRFLSLLAAGLIGAALFVPAGVLGSAQAKSLFEGWHSSYPAVSRLRGLMRSLPGNHYLAEDYNVLAYYLEDSVSVRQWTGTWNFSYTPPGAHRPLSGAAAYRAAFAQHYFSLVILDFGATPATDKEITTDMHRVGGYQLVDVVPSSFGHYTVWAYRPPGQPGQLNGHH